MSTPALIDYLITRRVGEVLVVDRERRLAQRRIAHLPGGRAAGGDLSKPRTIRRLIAEADIVISMLPVAFHYRVVAEAIRQRKPVVLASYLKDDLLELQHEAQRAGVPIIGECGADPGIDHAFLMQALDRIRQEGYQIQRVRTAAGALVLPEYLRDNPWRYKFSWAPRNVVLAAQKTSSYIEQGRPRILPYPRVFDHIRRMHVPHLGVLEGYTNADSTRYVAWYQVEGIEELWRGSLRYPGFIRSWALLARMGYTSPNIAIPRMISTYRALTMALLGSAHPEETLRQKGATDEDIERLRWLGLLEARPLPHRTHGTITAADALEHLLREKWSLQPEDRDVVVIHEEVEYTDGRHTYLWQGDVYAEGQSSEDTAIARLVGWPVGIVTRLLVQGRLQLPGGFYIPVIPEIYQPLLEELADLGVQLRTQTAPLATQASTLSAVEGK